MRAHASTGYQAYQKNKYETASPHRLIGMLYEGVIRFSTKAKQDLTEQKYEDANRSIQRVQDIIYELMSSLDFTQGGELASQLQSLYTYMIDRLLAANLKKQTEPLDEVIAIMGQIQSAWEQIGKDVPLGNANS